MNVYYHPGKANVVDDALSRLSMGNMSHIDDENKELVKKVHKLDRLGVRLADAQCGGVLVHSSSESSFAVDVKSNQHLNPVLMELKYTVLSKFNESFSLGGDGVLRYQNRLCMINVDNLRSNNFAEAHGSKHSIHPGATKMYHYLKDVYWWEGMMRDISKFVEECLNCQQVKAELLKPEGLTSTIEIPTWK